MPLSQVVNTADLVNIRLDQVLVLVLLASLESINFSVDPPIVHFVILESTFQLLVPQFHFSARLVVPTFSLLLDLLHVQLSVQRELTPVVE
jgi:hypothetical protein